MSKTIIISNRLPVSVIKTDNAFTYKRGIGGLETGLSRFHERGDSVWLGWPGISKSELNRNQMHQVEKALKAQFNCVPVHMDINKKNPALYELGNKTIWPLFHYFANKAEYSETAWHAYVEANQLFFEAASTLIENGDTIWIHDYHLMLLPELIKSKFPNVKIGFFLHIPFPSYEIYRLLVWRDEILHGLLGADLIGFHTYDYVRHFLSSVRRLLGYDHHLNRITYEDRYINVDAFPMGIDYDQFAMHFNSKAFHEEVERIMSTSKGEKNILSVDRLNYTKGIPEKVKAFGLFLQNHPEYIGKVRFNLVIAPSQTEIEAYDHLRSEIAELISVVNGKFGTVDWMPIWFYFQIFSQEQLIALYKYSDVLVVTPLRDGMNLVPKEYIAAKADNKGMVVISETAGAASELGEVVVVNANDQAAIAEGIKTALEMSDDEKRAINDVLHKRLKRYNVHFWAEDFLRSLSASGETSAHITTTNIEKNKRVVVDAYRAAKKRIIFLDYDGTLVGFKSIPNQAKPDSELKHLLYNLIENPKNTVVIVSGRDHYTLNDWLGDLRVQLLAAHGLWHREQDGEWHATAVVDNRWKTKILNIMQTYVDRMPGALIEEKEFSLSFHFRKCEPDMIAVKLGELRSVLSYAIESMNLCIQEGNRVLEVKDSRYDKGQSAALFLQNHDYDFVMGVGDDHSDEDLFKALPASATTIKIGMGATDAKYRLKSWKSMRTLLAELIK